MPRSGRGALSAAVAGLNGSAGRRVCKCRLAFAVPSAALLSRPPPRAPPPHMQVGMTGGDLEGGRDKDRNANVQALKSLFYQSAESDNATTTANATAAAEIGLLRDIPIARFQFVLLPHQQCAFNIFQPQLVHMYETLLATPEPWYYLHAHIARRRGESWQSRVRAADHRQWGRRPVGHAAGHAHASRGAEAQAGCAYHSHLPRPVPRRGPPRHAGPAILALRRPDAAGRGAAARMEASRRGRRRGDAGRSGRGGENCWRRFEFAPIEIRNAIPPPFANVNPEYLAECASKAAALEEASELPTPSVSDAGCDDALRCEMVRAVLDAAEVAAADDDEDDEDDAKQLSTLEVQAWLELDAFLRSVAAKKGGELPTPAQLVSLLPPPPQPTGWPEEFVLDQAAITLRERAAAQEAMNLFNPGLVDADSEPYVPCSNSDDYPARRRQQRLSFAIWATVCQDNKELQSVLEVAREHERSAA